MKKRILDGILGLCVGDAIGVPVESRSRQELEKNPVVEMRGFGTYNQPAGTWSDDSSMTLCLWDSLKKGLDYDDIMQNFCAWYKEGQYTPGGESFGIGKTTCIAIINYLRGEKALECGEQDEFSNGNGSLMRSLPLVFYIAKNDEMNQRRKEGMWMSEKGYETVHNISALTHAHPISLISCGIYVSILLGILVGSSGIEGMQAGVEAAFSYYTGDKKYVEYLPLFERLRNLTEFRDCGRNYIRSSGYVVDTLEAAVWCVVSTDSYRKCILRAVNLGDDTDTTAAVAGGMAGLIYGTEGIPEEWTQNLINYKLIENICFC